MPDYETHISKYRHNKNFVGFGISNRREIFDDWEIVGTFYAIIHLIEAILSKKYGIDSKDHDDRLTSMRDHYETFNGIYIYYGCLKSLAWTARYQGINEIDPNDARKAQEYCENIEYELKQYIP